MKLTDRVYLVGSGAFGFSMTDAFDCHVYLVDGGDELALIDAGAGMGVPEILENIEAEGFRPKDIKCVLLTHAHADHAGGAARMKSEVGADIMVSKDAAEFLRTGDEKAINLVFARRAGFYPQDYHLEACEVDLELEEGRRIAVGDCELCVIDTPGHCKGSVSFLMENGGRTYLFDGDTVFFGGKILLQNIHDCILQDYMHSVMKLAELSVDVLLPGHLTFSLRDGQRHIDSAAQAFRRLAVPPNVI